ncbi:MAG: hypothetical protein CL609_21690 [Anaerolineaceae bacterium]|nr:hypothetical protein [Anaerolineaceae bacterium]
MKLTSVFTFLLLLITACTPQVSTNLVITDKPTSISTQTQIPSPTATITPTQTTTKTPTPSPSPTPSITPTATFTPVPTYQILRGEVNVAHVSCFYGPSNVYLYKYGLVGGSNLEIIGQNLDTDYLKVQAIGGNNPCWMNSQWMNIQGSASLIQPINAEDVVLPSSPYYGPPSGQNAVRDEDQVTISWNWFGLRAGDDSEQYPYLIEAWLCLDGNITFTPIGTWENIVTVTDQAGCSEPSHARLYAVEKHGYTPYVEIPWPTLP